MNDDSKNIGGIGIAYRRRSVRKFTDEPVSDATLQQLIDAAIHAPSGKNMQNWHFVVIRNKAVIHQMAALVEEKHEYLLGFIPAEDKQKAF